MSAGDMNSYEKKAHSWLITNGSYVPITTLKPSYKSKNFNITGDASSGPRKAYPNKLDDEFRKKRFKQIVELLKAGVSTPKAYRHMRDQGKLTWKDKTLRLAGFRKLCTEARDLHKIPKPKPKYDEVINMVENGFSDKEIIDKLDVTERYIFGAKHRKKYAPNSTRNEV